MWFIFTCIYLSLIVVLCSVTGVPLLDGGTVRLPQLIGLSRAMDMILTGRPVGAKEALSFGVLHYCIML